MKPITYFTLAASLLVTSLAYAQGNPDGQRARITCHVSLNDYAKEIGQTDILIGDLSFDMMDAVGQTKTFEAKYGNQEILFRVDAVNFMNLDQKSVHLRVFDNFAAGKTDDFKESLKHELAGTLVGLPHVLNSDAQGYLDVKVPNTETIVASMVCIGKED